MKRKFLLIAAFYFITAFTTYSQVTQINSNNSLHVVYPLNSVKTITVSYNDSTIWATDGSLATTIQLSPTIKYERSGGLLSGKFIFRGRTAATGSELYITDGTAGGTTLVKDIYAGAINSSPADFQGLGSFVYFTAVTAANGRELWRSDGTNAGTTLVKDIVAGPTNSNEEGMYHLFSNGAFIVLAANTAAEGLELWKSDGTGAGTALLKDINTGVDSSNPKNFYILNNLILFTARNAANGDEIWKTDGTNPGTVIVKDINPGPGSSTEIEIFPGFSFSIFSGFHTFNNKVYFTATNDGASTGQLWGSDATGPNTILLSDIVPGTNASIILVINAVNLPSKFIFPVSDADTRSELWQSDGTPGGTVLFKSFTPPNAGDAPINLVPYNIINGVPVQNLFQGTKFFFIAGTLTDGIELWASDGTLAGTGMVKDINPGTGDGIDPATNFSYLYTNAELFFAANNGTNGNELWRTNGTGPGTLMVQDINLNAANANPELAIINNSKIIFSATDGNHATFTDLFVVDGEFAPVPVKLGGFSVKPAGKDALILWHTMQEINSANFTIQRSFDGRQFENIGIVEAAGNSDIRNDYEFTDRNIAAIGKNIFYYRLLTTDIDGKESLSNIISLRLKSMPWQIQLAGNPVRDIVNLDITGLSGNVEVSIKDLSGKSIYKNMLTIANSRLTVPVNNLPHGVYVISVYYGNEKKSLRFTR